MVTDRNGRCLYFSRSPIPFERQPGAGAMRFKKHVGLYAFTPAALQAWPGLPPGELEQRESLEQLRWLETGHAIYAERIEPTGPGVDTPQTLAEVRAILEGGAPAGAPAGAPGWADIELVVLDADGVLTDGRLVYLDAPELGKSFHVRDGLGVTLLQAASVRVGVLTGRADAATRRRIAALGLPAQLVIEGRHDKGAALRELAQRAGVALRAVAYMGDDVIDLGAMALAGRACAPADAHASARAAAHWISDAAGGHGAVRELAEQVLVARGHGAALVDPGAFEALLARRRVAQ